MAQFVCNKITFSDKNNNIDILQIIEKRINDISQEFLKKSINNGNNENMCLVDLKLKQYVLIFYFNKELNHNPYMMVYDVQLNQRVYAIDISNTPNIKKTVFAENAVRDMDMLIEYSEKTMAKGMAYMKEDMENYAEAVDRYEDMLSRD